MLCLLYGDRTNKIKILLVHNSYKIGSLKSILIGNEIKVHAMCTSNQTVRLISGYDIPLLGIGTYKIYDRDTIYKVLDQCLRLGYRLIDTAAVYRNEEHIGLALKDLLPKYNLTRKDIFITTKLSPSENGSPEGISNAVQKSLKALGTSYIDLYLIHWPGAAHIPVNSAQNADLRACTWKVLIELQKQGYLRSIGVSNYTVNHLEELLKNGENIIPAVNQVECHPHYRQEELIKYCKEKGIHVQAYSSLGTSGRTDLLRDPIVNRISNELAVSPGQLLLKWALQQGIGVIPKAVKTEHIRDNIELNFTIDADKMKSLSVLPQKKYAWDPTSVH